MKSWRKARRLVDCIDKRLRRSFKASNISVLEQYSYLFATMHLRVYCHIKLPHKSHNSKQSATHLRMRSLIVFQFISKHYFIVGNISHHKSSPKYYGTNSLTAPLTLPSYFPARYASVLLERSVSEALTTKIKNE